MATLDNVPSIKDEFEDDAQSQNSDELPFAIADDADHADPTVESGSWSNHDKHGCSQETEQTTMNSSVLTSQSQEANSDDCSFIEFDAAASFLADDSTLFDSHSSAFNNIRGDGDVAMQSAKTSASMDFSQLMREADDDQTQRPALLPSLPEDRQADTPTSSVLTPRATNLSYSIFDSVTKSNSQSGSRTSTSNSSYLKRGIEVTNIDAETFEVSLHVYSPCSTQDVMDICGNPDLLRLWCEPVRTLVVHSASEGSRNAIDRGDAGRDREYDGEWVEATTSTLVGPSNTASQVYQTAHYLWSYLGFPSYGKITMFVERRRGKLGLNIGPFAGDLTTFHTMTVTQQDGFIKISDKVRVKKEQDSRHSSFSCCCGLFDTIERCFMPKLDDHIDQCIASMGRLRGMIENGETSFEYASPDLIVQGDEECASRVPLLS